MCSKLITVESLYGADTIGAKMSVRFIELSALYHLRHREIQLPKFNVFSKYLISYERSRSIFVYYKNVIRALVVKVLVCCRLLSIFLQLTCAYKWNSIFFSYRLNSNYLSFHCFVIMKTQSDTVQDNTHFFIRITLKSNLSSVILYLSNHELTLKYS